MTVELSAVEIRSALVLLILVTSSVLGVDLHEPSVVQPGQGPPAIRSPRPRCSCVADRRDPQRCKR